MDKPTLTREIIDNLEPGQIADILVAQHITGECVHEWVYHHCCHYTDAEKATFEARAARIKELRTQGVIGRTSRNWPITECSKCDTGGGTSAFTQPGGITCPRYTTDIALAWEVVNLITQAGHTVYTRSYRDEGCGCTVLTHWNVELAVEAPTIPLAICKAGLLWVVEVTRDVSER